MILSKKRLTKQSNETKVPRFHNSRKGNKVRYEANDNIMEKIDKAIRAIEKGKIERCQKKLAEGKKIFLKQQKLLRIADMEDDEWEVVKCYLSDNLASDSEEEKQLSRARRDAAANKKKREANKQKDKKETVSKCPITLFPSFCASNNKFSLRSSKFLSQTISKLLRNNCIEEIDQKSYCCNPLTVAESKKLQIALDLRHVNIFIKQNKFRYGKLTTL